MMNKITGAIFLGVLNISFASMAADADGSDNNTTTPIVSAVDNSNDSAQTPALSSDGDGNTQDGGNNGGSDDTQNNTNQNDANKGDSGDNGGGTGTDSPTDVNGDGQGTAAQGASVPGAPGQSGSDGGGDTGGSPDAPSNTDGQGGSSTDSSQTTQTGTPSTADGNGGDSNGEGAGASGSSSASGDNKQDGAQTAQTDAADASGKPAAIKPAEAIKAIQQIQQAIAKAQEKAAAGKDKEEGTETPTLPSIERVDEISTALEKGLIQEALPKPSKDDDQAPAAGAGKEDVKKETAAPVPAEKANAKKYFDGLNQRLVTEHGINQEISAKMDYMQSWQTMANDRINDLERVTAENRKISSRGIAGVAAMANIPTPTDGSFAVGVGYGYYDSQNAFALGASKYFESGIAIKGGVALTGKSPVVGAGASYSFK